MPYITISSKLLEKKEANVNKQSAIDDRFLLTYYGKSYFSLPWNVTFQNIWSTAQNSSKGHKSSPADKQSTLNLLMSNKWASRVWIIQELANSKRASLGCTERWIDARAFSLAPRLLGIEPNAQCQAVIDIMPGPSRSTSWWNEKPDLSTLLWRFRESQTSDPRDRLYALLGLASDKPIKADYTKTEEAVVGDIIVILNQYSLVLGASLVDGTNKFLVYTLSLFICLSAQV